MKRVLSVLLLLLAGCVVQSFGPFCTDKSIIYVKDVIGEWTLQKDFGEDVSTNAIRTWVFAGSAATNCTLKAFDKENLAATFAVQFFTLGKNMFADVMPAEPSDGTKINSYWGWTTRAVHTVCKAKLDDNGLTLIPLDYDWLKERLKERKAALPYIGSIEELPLVTASPQQWEALLSKHAANPDAFQEKHAFVLKRNRSAKP